LFGYYHPGIIQAAVLTLDERSEQRLKLIL